MKKGKNFQKDEKNNYFLVDFEECCYTSQSWEISRALMEVNPKNFNSFINEYIQKIGIKNGGILKDSIKRDFLIRVISDAIGLQLMLGNEKARPYVGFLKRNYSLKIKEILNGKD